MEVRLSKRGNDDVDYGNHSCADCAVPDCPISNYSVEPNDCSAYFPPDTPANKNWQSVLVYLDALASERESAGMNPHAWIVSFE